MAQYTLGMPCKANKFTIHLRDFNEQVGNDAGEYEGMWLVNMVMLT